jgi:hypothetical protein
MRALPAPRMDPRTLSFYERHAVAFADRDATAGPGVSRYFPLAFPAGARIADVGAGSGRDSALLVRAGSGCWSLEQRRCHGLRWPKYAEGRGERVSTE